MGLFKDDGFTGMAAMKKFRKKNRRLISQTLLMTAGLFAVVVIVLISSSSYFSFQIYLDSREELLDSPLTQIGGVTSLYHPLSYYMDYWNDKIDDDVYWMSGANENGQEVFTQLIQGATAQVYGESSDIEGLGATEQTDIAQSITRERLESLSDEEQEDLTQAVYNQLFDVYIDFILEQDKFDLISCIRIDGEDNSYIVVGGYREAKSKNKDSCMVYDFGEPIPENLMQQKTVQSLLSGTNVFKKKQTVYEVQKGHQTGKDYYYGYFPIMEDGKIVAVVCVAYDISGFNGVLRTYQIRIILFLSLGLLVFSGLLVLFLYRSAIRPLSVVTDGILKYMSDKDSEKAQEMMAGVKTRNEVGDLATSFGEMVAEIDAYTKESLRINSEKERAEAEMTLAARIQQEALPHEFPDRKDFTLAASMTPARDVGGDFYDFFFIDEDHLGLVIADVSDKGIPAALFMMMSKDMIKNYTMAGSSPAQVLQSVNGHLCENNKNGMFVTVWLGVLELSTGNLTAANAGHEYPMLRRADSSFELIKDVHGTMLGFFKERQFKNYVLQMKEGDTLFVYTDGATEATSPDGVLFGTSRMLKVLNADPNRSPHELIDGMKDAIDAYSAEAGQFDDLTMLSICYHGRKEETDFAYESDFSGR